MSSRKNELTVVFIGGGKMGEALVGGWISSDSPAVADFSPANFTIVEPTAERRAYLTDRYGVTCVQDAASVSKVDVVVLAVKPQVMFDVLEALHDLPAFENGLFISIAAGLKTENLRGALPASAHLVRVMPNLPLLVGAGASVVCGSASSTEDDVVYVKNLFASLGIAEIIDESLMDAACALSGSGPAYVAAMIESLVQAGVKQGLPAALAETLALQTVYGTALQLKETGQEPAVFRAAVSSPGGTTMAALEAMHDAGMDNVYDQGVTAAVRRGKELGTCKA